MDDGNARRYVIEATDWTLALRLLTPKGCGLVRDVEGEEDEYGRDESRLQHKARLSKRWRMYFIVDERTGETVNWIAVREGDYMDWRY